MDVNIAAQRRRLEADALRAKESGNEAWIEPQLWSQYTGKEGRALYESFSDEELLDMLRSETAKLGRFPSQHEIFCVYRMYIRKRFRNWPTALRRAGLKKPRKKHRYDRDEGERK